MCTRWSSEALSSPTEGTGCNARATVSSGDPHVYATGHPVTPPLSVVVPWRDRPEFEETLAANCKVLPTETQWIVVNGGGDKATLDAMVVGFSVTVVHLPLLRWSKGPVQNVGASFAESERLLLLDCDIVFDATGWSQMRAALQPRTVVTMAKVFDDSLDITPDADPVVNQMELTIQDREVVMNRSRYWPAEGARSGPGVALVHTEDFRRVGGLVGSLPRGLGFLDVDLLIRLDVAGVKRSEAGFGRHIDGAATTRSPARVSGDGTNFDVCMARYQAGQFHGTSTADQRKWLPLATVRHVQ